MPNRLITEYIHAQGDLAIRILPNCPWQPNSLHLLPCLENGSVVLHTGEKEGHQHILVMDDPSEVAQVEVALSEAWAKATVHTKSGAKVVHNTHGTIDIPAGSTAVITRQREMSDNTPVEIID